MLLKSIRFDSFKSLVNEKLDINYPCTGIVGINESGKSNILQAIRILNNDYHLNKTHVPKIQKGMRGNQNPKIRYEFTLKDDQRDRLMKSIYSWLKTNTLVGNDLSGFNLHIEFIIEYDLIKEMEFRDFHVTVKDISGAPLILKREFFESEHKLFHNNKFISLNEAIIVTENLITSSEESLQKVRGKKKELEAHIQDFKNSLLELEEDAMDPDVFFEAKNKIKSEIEKLDLQLKDFEKDSSIDVEKIIELEEKQIEELSKAIRELEENVLSLEKTVNTYKSRTTVLSPVDKGLLTKASNNLQSTIEKLEKKKQEFTAKEENLNLLKVPLIEKYSKNPAELDYYITQLLNIELPAFLPKVVFWEHSKNFILDSKTKFEEILGVKEVTDISRPLFNVFRIGLEIDSLKELKEKILFIKEDDGERSRLEKLINKNLNRYIDAVWTDYDQDIKITLEEHQVRIEFYDPAFDGSFFNMDEKSQGAQTFLSFLLTIGAEAAQGVLKNKILLLDEPETHLHPSGVRFMLKELIKISEKENIVLYATHSVFMIDKLNYDRHIFLKKKNEKTSIKISAKDRIGFFMQEEVLFGALGFDLENEFNTKNVFNFVFEGNGDVLLFEKFYSKILGTKNRPFDLKKATFFQGGKCNDIMKFLKKNPIKLGTKWIFIIDNDSAGNGLKRFIESNYKYYIGKEIFIYQYRIEGKEEVELEDLLNDEFLKEVYQKTCKTTKNILKNLDGINIEEQGFIKYNDLIMEKLAVKDAEVYKGEWKSQLNKLIEQSLEKVTEEQFQEKFPKYRAWVSDVLEDLKSSSKSGGVSKNVEGIPVTKPSSAKKKNSAVPEE